MNLNRLSLGAAGAALALSAAVLSPATASALTSAGSGPDAHRAPERSVSYLGHTFRVPADWEVIDLTADPHACVHFGRSALYLGDPSDSQDCGTRVVGRTEALLVQPDRDAATGTARTTVNTTGQEIHAVGGGVRVTAAYGSDHALVSRILAGADLPTETVESAGAAGTAAPTPQRTTARRGATAESAAPEEVGTVAAPQAVAAVPAASTNYTGKGFDACAAPSGTTMNGWMADSPYGAVGIYIGGNRRACPQPNLTAAWVQQQASAGWRFMPLYVGPQATELSSPAAQGAAAADDAANQAASLGFAPGSLLYYDMESYSRETYSTRVLTFLSAWTNQLHARGYTSAVYSSSSTGIADLVANVNGYAMPDAVFAAKWNNAADTNDSVLPAGYWSNHQRVHQYAGNVTETWHGISINIDRDYLDVQVAPTAPTTPTVPPVPSGSSFFHGTRLADGRWAGLGALNGVGDAPFFVGSEAAIAGMPDGSAQVVGIGNDGSVYHRTRLADGIWTGFAPLAGVGSASMQASSVAIAGLPDGSSQVVAVGSDGNVYHESRSPDGRWTGFAPLAGVGTWSMQASRVAIAGLPDGTAQVLAVGNDGNVYHESRLAGGSWTGFAPLAGAGTVAMQARDVAITGLSDGTSQVLVVGSDGNVYHEQRMSSGDWTGFVALEGVGTPTMQASSVSIAGLPDGSSQVVAVGNDGNVYHEARRADAGWSGFHPIAGYGGAPTFNGPRAAITALPDGSTQILAIGR
ncbi:hypothetical protein GCM10020229_51810 [Kitasatospora albolonga]|uniref:glycoside hydrolase domain-containing protein n=1 Tax=Kitasatospora albolonga TaxID=68173 RepID=UPI0031E90BC1